MHGSAEILTVLVILFCAETSDATDHQGGAKRKVLWFSRSKISCSKISMSMFFKVH